MSEAISVVIPVYNGAEFLAECIESALTQTRAADEILVVDDGSIDNTHEVASRYSSQIQYVHTPHSGAPAARNEGIRRSTGSMIAFLDADDLWVREKLNTQLELMRQNPDVQIVSGISRYFDSHTQFEPALTLDFVCALFRKSVFNTVGLLDETLMWCDDWDWFLRSRELEIPMLIHEDVVRLYRRHEKNITNDKDQVGRHLLQVLRSSLSRRRTENGASKSLPIIAKYLYQSKQRRYDS